MRLFQSDPSKYEVEIIPPPLTRLTWADVMDVSPVLQSTSEKAKNELIVSLSDNVGKMTALALKGADLIVNKGNVVVKMNEVHRAMRGVQFLTDSTGKQLPILVKPGSRFLSTGRIVAGGASATGAVAATVGAVVIVAHMISGADNAQKLAQANKKLDFLLFARRLDQCSRIEAVFRQAKELSSLPDSVENRREIHRLGLILHELRAIWRGEAKRKLSEIDPKSPTDTNNWLLKPIRYMTSGKNGRRAAHEMYQSIAELHLLNVNLGLHMAIAQASGTAETFMTHSLGEEMAGLQNLLDDVNNLTLEVAEKHKDAHEKIGEVREAFERTIQTFRPLVIGPLYLDTSYADYVILPATVPGKRIVGTAVATYTDTAGGRLESRANDRGTMATYAA